MHTYHGDGLETKYLAICGDRFRLLNVTPFARELRATRVHAGKRSRSCSNRSSMQPKQRICISTALYFFDIELYAVALRPPSPPPRPIRPCAKLRAASASPSTSESISRYILANLSISTILNSSPRPRLPLSSRYLASISRYNGPPLLARS